jgi:cytochrome c-type protein NapB
MRGQDRPDWRVIRTALAAALLLLSLAAAAQELGSVKQLSGNAPPTAPVKPAPAPRPVTNDVRQMRNYPEQPPIIPHSIDGYQLTLTTNRCLACHARQFTQGSGAPMISVTHFMDRDGQILADVTPRRYFCTQCHVPQVDAPPLVPNTFHDAVTLGDKDKP